MNDSQFDLRAELANQVRFVLRLFTADVQAMSHEQLATNHGGESRCGYDFLFELNGFFRLFGAMLASGPSDIEGPSGGWIRAPKEAHDREKALTELSAAADAFLAALSTYSGDLVNDQFPSPAGTFTPIGMGFLAVSHVMYHSGQLNYIQTINGDAEFHWMQGSPA